MTLPSANTKRAEKRQLRITKANVTRLKLGLKEVCITIPLSVIAIRDEILNREQEVIGLTLSHHNTKKRIPLEMSRGLFFARTS
jgi:hypothetical protein